MRAMPKSDEFDPLQFFMECANPVSVGFIEEESTDDDLFMNTLGLAARVKQKENEIVFWEGFALDQNRIARRHFWVEADGQHLSLSRSGVELVSAMWGVPIPDMALTICTMSAVITTSNGCIGVTSLLPPDEQKELAWILNEPHNEKTPVTNF